MVRFTASARGRRKFADTGISIDGSMRTKIGQFHPAIPDGEIRALTLEPAIQWKWCAMPSAARCVRSIPVQRCLHALLCQDYLAIMACRGLSNALGVFPYLLLSTALLQCLVGKLRGAPSKCASD